MDRDICTGRIKARNKARPSILKAVGKVTLVLAPRAPASPSPPCCCPRASAACLPACLPGDRPPAFTAPLAELRRRVPGVQRSTSCLPGRTQSQSRRIGQALPRRARCCRPYFAVAAAPPAARLARELRPCSRARRARGPSSLVCAPRFGELLRRSGGSGLLVLLPVVRRRRRPKISCFFLVFGFC
jgi:hypothetical protein